MQWWFEKGKPQGLVGNYAFLTDVSYSLLAEVIVFSTFVTVSRNDIDKYLLSLVYHTWRARKSTMNLIVAKARDKEKKKEKIK